MDEIKTENSLNAVCHGCLSRGRKTSTLGTLTDMFLSIIGSQKITTIYSIQDIKLCWECKAMLEKLKDFQNRLKKAQHVLMQMLYDLDYTPVTLSKLAISKKDQYEHNIQHSDTEIANEINKPTNLDIEIEIKACNEPLDIENIDTIKQETYTEDDSFVDNDLSNDQHEYNCNTKSEISEFNINNYDLNSIIKEGSYTESNEELNSTKKVRAKRRKLEKSRHNSVGYYKQYTTIIEREKIDWGNVENYFTMVKFNEAEMEEHFLMKERKFSEYSRFKHKCVPCELGFMRSFDLKRHKDLNHNKKSDFKCSFCHKPQWSQQELDSHWQDHTPVARCNICGDFCRPRGMKMHMNYAHTKKYACQFCNMTFGKILHFSFHYKEMHQNYICDYCNASCKTKILVEKHIRTYHTKFTCKICNREFHNYRQYKRHNNEMHPNRFKERPELAYCVECDKQYASVSKYKKHLKISPKHIEVKPILLPCPDCGKIFKRKNYLNNHYNLYHAKKSKHYCELCDKYFANGYGLRKHKAYVHMKISRVKDKMCDLCGRGFAAEETQWTRLNALAVQREGKTNRILQNHRRTHTGERPYQCPFCSAAFAQKQAMQSHCRTQHKEIK